jgi:hypothetical protein
MGEMENNDVKIIKTDGKTYNLENTEEAIDFLIFALNGKRNYCFIEEYVFGHLGIAFYDYIDSLEETDKNFFVILDDIKPFFNIFIQDWEADNVFYKYIYSSQISDLVKKQKINKIIDGLKKTLDSYFNFDDLSRFRNMFYSEEPMDNFKKFAHQKELSDAYLYFCATFRMIDIYNYLYSDFYSFIDEKNKIDPSYSNEDKKVSLEELEHYYQKSPEGARRYRTMEAKINPTDCFPDIFKSIEVYNSFKDYTSKFIIDPYNDLSYLFQRMLHEKLIHKKTHFEYFDWLKNNKFINDKDYDKFYVKSCFVSFNKSTSANRENNFNVIFSL